MTQWNIFLRSTLSLVFAPACLNESSVKLRDHKTVEKEVLTSKEAEVDFALVGEDCEGYKNNCCQGYCLYH